MRAMFRLTAVAILVCSTTLAADDKPTPIAAPDGWSIEAYDGIALSPDSLHVAFVVQRIEHRIAVASTLDPGDVRILDGTEGAGGPFWSPDGQTIAFFRGEEMRAVDLGGKRAWKICDCRGKHGSWGSAGVILYSRAGLKEDGAILAVAENGPGPPHAVTTLDESTNEYFHDWPEFMPDGKRFVFSAIGYQKIDPGRIKNTWKVFLTGLGDRRREMLMDDGDHGAMLDAGTLLFTREDRQLWMLALARGGAPEAQSGAIRAFHTNGSGGYVRAEIIRSTQLAWVDRSGKVLDIVATKGTYTRPRISPDGKLVAYSDRVKLFVRDLLSGSVLATFDSAWGVAWSPNSSQVATAMTIDGKCQIVVADVATSALHSISSRCGQVFDWSRDGRYIATDSAWGHKFDFIAVDGSASVLDRELVQSQPQGWLRFAPDGRSVAFDARAQTGTAPVFYNVYTATTEFRGSDVLHDAQPKLISPTGGDRPAWRADGRELFFVDGERRLWSVPMPGNDRQPEMLFVIPRGDGPFAEYDVSADGTRFVVNREVDDALLYVRFVKHD